MTSTRTFITTLKSSGPTKDPRGTAEEKTWESQLPYLNSCDLLLKEL